ncbi:MAG: helix-turn-helix domain-containing protein [Leptospiraceae bacterium]
MSRPLSLPQPKLLHFSPPQDLSPYVRRLYLIEAPNTGIDQFVPAWTSTMMVLQYSDPVYSSINGDHEIVPDICFSGMVSKKYGFFTPASMIKLMIVEFTSIGFYSLFREQAHRITDISVDGTDIIPARKQSTIVEALQETDDVWRKANLVFDFLRSFIPSKIPGKLHNVQNALAIMAESSFGLDVRTVADELAVSERNLRRSFKDIVGLSPKMFARIERFTKLFNTQLSGQKIPWRALKQRSLFFDQAHMIRDFRSFTGYSPTQLPAESFFLYHVLTR